MYLEMMHNKCTRIKANQCSMFAICSRCGCNLANLVISVIVGSVVLVCTGTIVGDTVHVLMALKTHHRHPQNQSGVHDRDHPK